MSVQDRTLTAAGLILIYAAVIGFGDNFVRVIAEDGGLWQFHAMRSALALVLLAAAAGPLGLRMRPRNLRGVAGRSAVHGLAMLVYFGSLAFLPVAQVAAGLFTAPIFVLLIARFAYGQPIGPLRILAVAAGFLGVLLVLGPGAAGAMSAASLMPIVAGALYAVGNVATRAWCEGESAETLLAGFFAVLGVLGLIGLLVLAVLTVDPPAGADGFISRGWVWPSARLLFWTSVQAVGSVVGVGLMIRAYQMAEAARVSVFEYAILPASAFWGWVIWGERLDLLAVVGMGLIASAGIVIALGAAQPASAGSPTASRQ